MNQITIGLELLQKKTRKEATAEVWERERISHYESCLMPAVLSGAVDFFRPFLRWKMSLLFNFKEMT